MSAVRDLVALVVEDDGFQRRTVARMLRSLGACEVREAEDGRAALRSMHGPGAVDLVVCDLDMPGMDGMEFMRHLGQEKCSASVVISSAKERPLVASVEKMALAYGVHLLGLIEKPVTLSGLEDLLAKRNATDPQLQMPAMPDVVFRVEEILEGVRRHQFVPFYQPKLDLATGRVSGMEVLARWLHPDLGLIGPSAFIPLLELASQIDGLTMSIIEQASNCCRKLLNSGSDLVMSMNLSLVSLTDTVMADRISHLVRNAGLDPRRVIFEITETAAMTRVAPALENLARLRMRGFGLSVDDYGTGFASLQQLMRVPFTELKIDQAFVTGCGTNAGSRIIVESSVAMARKLGMKSVAEGVESEADLKVVKAACCDMAQGYYIARPMGEEDFAESCAAQAMTALGG
jgi:EAL domain-containing protein (putative c-di-GMP-specific phosphodiesterase class I)/FixJ family two-component response regulator